MYTFKRYFPNLYDKFDVFDVLLQLQLQPELRARAPEAGAWPWPNS